MRVAIILINSLRASDGCKQWQGGLKKRYITKIKDVSLGGMRPFFIRPGSLNFMTAGRKPAF